MKGNVERGILNYSRYEHIINGLRSGLSGVRDP
jgi:hypothetical protein